MPMVHLDCETASFDPGSCRLLAAGRHQELLDLIETAPYLWWHFGRYGVRALAAQGRTDEAILLAAGRGEESYRRFAYVVNRVGSHLATFRAIKTTYPDKPPGTILDDLIAQTPGKEGKWFATAKDLGLLDLALDLARRSPVDIGTRLRAARNQLDSEPAFALETATTALSWIPVGSASDWIPASPRPTAADRSGAGPAARACWRPADV